MPSQLNEADHRLRNVHLVMVTILVHHWKVWLIICSILLLNSLENTFHGLVQTFNGACFYLQSFKIAFQLEFELMTGEPRDPIHDRDLAGRRSFGSLPYTGIQLVAGRFIADYSVSTYLSGPR